MKLTGQWRLVRVSPVVIGASLAILAAGAAAQSKESADRGRLDGMELDADLDSITARLRIAGRDDSAIATHWAARSWQQVVELAHARIRKHPKDHRGHALEFLAYAELKQDRALATRFAVRALRDLGDRPGELAEFVRRAMFANPTRNDYQLALMALVPVVPEARKDPRVRAAHVEALLGCGKAKEALVTNKAILDDLAGDLAGLRDLARVISQSRHGRAMRDVAKRAIGKVIAAEGENEANLLIRFALLHNLFDDEKAAAALGQRIVDKVDASGLNDWTWYLMTRRSTAGRYPTLARIAARRLAKLPDLGFHEYDTIALALFRNGELARAVDYQKRALAAGASNDPDYRRRMRRYEAALAARAGKRSKRKN